MSNKKKMIGYELLRSNHAGAMRLKDGRTVNYGIIRINENEIVFYTGKGLREMWKPTMTEEEKKRAQVLREISEEEGGEQKLIASEHIAILPFDEIDRIVF